jgi:MinD-like ATPase involved in chromosome partitioning or flagellar assembly
MKTKTRVVFTQGGKGGVAKTEVVLSLIPWYRQQGIQPVLLDFDFENTNKSGLQNFYPEARKFDVHIEGALDEFFDVCDRDDVEVVIADLGAGAGSATYSWFDQAFDDAEELGIRFTSIGVTTNEAGAVQSILKWAAHLQDRVDYLIVLNELREPGSKFEYWNDEPAVARFIEAFSPVIMPMGARIQEFQSEMRNWSTTLQAVIEMKVEAEFLKRTKNVVRAKRYQRQLFEGFDQATSILLP